MPTLRSRPQSGWRATRGAEEKFGFLSPRHILFLLCAGSYATNLGMVPIGSNDPPAEAGFCFSGFFSIERCLCCRL
ncbi:hypothetical protein [Mesorhizobium sp. M0898]|uniref:hypothetical protein n=1 Tax=Mesorhizobium sp. M0898 TaxID=2957020 RepID=UPI00333B8251